MTSLDRVAPPHGSTWRPAVPALTFLDRHEGHEPREADPARGTPSAPTFACTSDTITPRSGRQQVASSTAGARTARDQATREVARSNRTSGAATSLTRSRKHEPARLTRPRGQPRTSRERLQVEGARAPARHARRRARTPARGTSRTRSSPHASCTRGTRSRWPCIIYHWVHVIQRPTDDLRRPIEGQRPRSQAPWTTSAREVEPPAAARGARELH